MKIHSITTGLGAACLASIDHPTHPVEAPEGWGLILYGRCNRTQLMTIALGSKAAWIADYDIKRRVAIVIWPSAMAGKTFSIDTSVVDAICPDCGSTEYVSSGVNWRCGRCDRQWRKSSAGKRGRPPKN